MSMARYVFTVSAYKDARGYGTADTGVRTMRSRELMPKNEAAIKSFLGMSGITSKTAIFPAYYGELLAWALIRYMEREHWQTAGILGYHYSEPVYANVSTDYHKVERILVDGQLLIDNGNHHLVITVDAGVCSKSMVTVEGGAISTIEVKKFVDGIKTIVMKENYYRHKKIGFDGRIRFMDVCDEPWGNINLAPAVKEQIKASTIGLLENDQTWTKYSLPLKRCVLLTGGTKKDKAAICQALMAEAVGITCIIAYAHDLDNDCAAQLYHLARDLSPCIVFMRDIDRFSQRRMKPGCHPGESLLSLLTILGSVEEYERIVTVATTSCSNTLSEAMFY